MALKMKRHKGARKGKEMSDKEKGTPPPKSIKLPAPRPPLPGS